MHPSATLSFAPEHHELLTGRFSHAGCWGKHAHSATPSPDSCHTQRTKRRRFQSLKRLPSTNP